MTTNITIQKIKDNLKDFRHEVFFNGNSADGCGFLTSEEKQGLRDSFNKFIDNNIYGSYSQEVEYILNKSYEDNDTPFNIDDVVNSTIINEESLINDIIQEFEELDKKDKGEMLELINEDNKTNMRESLEGYDQEEFESFLRDVDCYINIELYDYEEQQEVFEWFGVSSWLSDKLEAKEEVIIKGFNYWGRTCYGQGIVLDYVMHKIYLDILLNRLEQ